MTISRFHVAEMDCAAEEQLVRMALSGVDGVNLVNVDLELRDVVVDHNTSADAIGEALDALRLGTRHIDDDSEITSPGNERREHRALVFAFAINAAFFVGELTVGVISGSMGLIADALDMGADAGVYALSLAAVGTAAARKKTLARTSGFVQLALAAIGLVEVVRRFLTSSDLAQRASMSVGRGDDAQHTPTLRRAEALLLMAGLEPSFRCAQPDLKNVRPVGPRRIRFAVANAASGGHALELASVDDARATHRILVRERALANVGDDLGIAVRVAREACAWRETVFV